MTSEYDTRIDRRTMLAGLAGIAGTSLAGCAALERGEDSPTGDVDTEWARELAERFAPTLYFDEHEPWFPTDPRPFESERDGETVVDGFDALDGYHEQADDGAPPDPTVFYNAVTYENSPLAVVQFWFYSVFDQFTTNFHWHDWEVFHVFVDTETDRPQLYVASSHSRRVPNNEFLDPDPDRVPRILSELGSHSSALSVNDVPDRFQRLSIEGLVADITNSAIEGLGDLAGLPMAYGLPRDEDWRLPFVVPEYEGAPVYDHEDLPAVTRDSLVDEALSIRSFASLASPPTDLPTRVTGLRFEHRDRAEAEAGEEEIVGYELVPTTELEHITAFTGPQLSFEFDVPAAVEDAIAGHITTTGVPWDQPRYENPAADISVPDHRAALAERYEGIGQPAPINMVVSHVSEAIASDEAPDEEGLTTTDTHVESVLLLESDPEAVPTFGGVAVVMDVPDGEHRLTVNGAGRTPHSEQISVEAGGSTTAAGVDGEIPLVARENARKLEIRGSNADVPLSSVAVEDDFAGRLYQSPVAGDDAVYVHAGGAYTTEVRDDEDEIGAYRVNPDPGGGPVVSIDRPETGKAPLAEFVADIADETRSLVQSTDDGGDGDDADSGQGGTSGSENAVQGLTRALEAVVEAARNAAEAARAGDRGNADRRLTVVADRLQRVTERLSEASDDLPDPVSNASARRLDQANRRTDQAREAATLGRSDANAS